eukprot:GABV01001265.1.p1 GENE.GABV01001265.1~~GABV01001265.1.p1  ORF type:complete len:190 (-),score=56.98 GABV01001265.1:30-599(-)
MEEVDGVTIRDFLLDIWNKNQHYTPSALELMHSLGHSVAKLHAASIIHGDLTTSNFLVRNARSASPAAPSASETSTDAATSDDQDVKMNPVEESVHRAVAAALPITHEGDWDARVVAIDFGLSSTSVSDEDRAVDLYVLERAMSSTHPKSEPLVAALLEGYQQSRNSKRPSNDWKKFDFVDVNGRWLVD